MDETNIEKYESGVLLRFRWLHLRLKQRFSLWSTYSDFSSSRYYWQEFPPPSLPALYHLYFFFFLFYEADFNLVPTKRSGMGSGEEKGQRITFNSWVLVKSRNPNSFVSIFFLNSVCIANRKPFEKSVTEYKRFPVDYTVLWGYVRCAWDNTSYDSSNMKFLVIN